jgi:iron-sulfur cluster repair protein YtfE (RIC family)
MSEQPLHRHPSLQPLSRHHHHALVMAQKLLHSNDDDAQSVTTALQNFWQSHGDQHFYEEESLLLPTFAKYADVQREEVIQMLLDHVKIRAQIQIILSDHKPNLSALHALGDSLQRHVRFEERVVFPLIQETVPEEELQRLPDFTVTS